MLTDSLVARKNSKKKSVYRILGREILSYVRVPQ